MPVKDNQRIVSLRGFPHGLQREAAPVSLPEGALVHAANVVLRHGSIEKRKGFSKFSTSDPAAMNYGTSLFTFISGTTFWLIYIDVDGEIYYEDVSTGSTFVRANDGSGDLSVGDQRCDGITFDGTFYLTSVSGDSFTFDGTSWTTITDHVLNGGASEFPLAETLIVLHDRVFAFSTVESSTAHHSRVRWSNAADPLTWDAADFIDINAGDGGRINDVVVMGDRMLIFKNYSMYVLAGADPLTFSVIPVSDEQGTIAGRTAVEAEGIVYYYDNRSGVWATDGNQFEFISEPISAFMQDNIDVDVDYWTYPYTAHAFIHENRYHLCLTRGDETHTAQTFVFDLTEKAWTWWTMAPQAVSVRDQFLYGVGMAYESHETDGDVGPMVGVFNLYAGSSDLDAAEAALPFAAQFTTAWLTPTPEDGFMGKARLDAARYYHTAGNVGVFVFYDFDGSDWDDLITSESLKTINDVLDVNSQILTAWHPGEHYAFAIGFDNFTLDPWNFHGFDLFFTVRPTTRGDASNETVRQRYGS